MENTFGTIQPKPVLTATEMFDDLNDGKLKAIWILCTNPLVSLKAAVISFYVYKESSQELLNKPKSVKEALLKEEAE